MKHNYSISSYNKYICLKMDYIMWFIFLFLLKPYVILIFSFSDRSDRMKLIEMIYTDKFMMSLGAFVGIPAALLIYAWSRRNPDGSDFVRKIWSKGRELLTVSTSLNALLVFLPLFLGRTNKLSLTDWVQLAICIVILLVLYGYSYIRVCFLEFPDKNP